MDLELLQLLKALGGSAPGMPGWQPTPTDLTNASQQTARPWVGVKPALSPEGTAPRVVPQSYSNPRTFEVQGSGLKQIGGPLLSILPLLLPALLGRSPWGDVEALRRQRFNEQLGPQPAGFWDTLNSPA